MYRALSPCITLPALQPQQRGAGTPRTWGPLHTKGRYRRDPTEEQLCWRGGGKHMNCLAWCWVLFCFLHAQLLRISIRPQSSQLGAPRACPRSPGFFSALSLILIWKSFCSPLTVGDIGMSGPFMVHPALSFLPSVPSVWKTLPVFPNSRRRSPNSRGSTFLWEGGQAGHNQSSKSCTKEDNERDRATFPIPRWPSCSAPFSRDGLSPLRGLSYAPAADTSTRCGKVTWWNGMYTGLLGEVELQEQLGNGRGTCGLWLAVPLLV